MAITSRDNVAEITMGAPQGAPTTSSGRGYRIPAAAPTQDDPTPAVPGRLIVGEGIEISGEIASCDVLVVEGRVKADSFAAARLDLRSSGGFHGGAEVEQAEIAGTFEGSLTVNGTLSITPSGRVSGKITYGDLQIARGGKITGELTSKE